MQGARVGSILMADGPLIVQSDRTVLLEVAHPDAESARHELAIFAELERAPEHIHTYRITRLGLWNARAAGHDSEDMLATLDRWTRFPVPPSVSIDIRETVGRYGRLVIERDDEGRLVLRSTDAAVLAEVSKNKRIQPLLIGRPSPDAFLIDAWARGHIKQELLKIGWPAEDLAGYTPGTPHPIELAEDGHAHPRDQHRERPAVARRAAAAHLAHRGGDRRILRPGQRGQARHHRDVSDPHRQAGRPVR